MTIGQFKDLIKDLPDHTVILESTKYGYFQTKASVTELAYTQSGYYYDDDDNFIGDQTVTVVLIET